MNRRSVAVGKVVGRVGDTFYCLDELFEYEPEDE